MKKLLISILLLFTFGFCIACDFTAYDIKPHGKWKSEKWGISIDFGESGSDAEGTMKLGEENVPVIAGHIHGDLTILYKNGTSDSLKDTVFVGDKDTGDYLSGDFECDGESMTLTTFKKKLEIVFKKVEDATESSESSLK